MKDILYDKNAKKCIIILMAIIVLYIIGSIYFKNHFFFRTYIDGINISCKTPDEAKGLIYENVKDFRLKVCGRNDITDEIMSKDIQLEYVGEEKVEQLKNTQNCFFWLSALMDKKESDNIKLFSYNDSMLKNKIINLKCVSAKDIVEPQNAEFQYTGGKYIIIEEIQGNKIDNDKLCDAIKRAVEYGKKTVDLDNEGCYEKPQYTKDSKEVIEAKNIMDKYVSSKIVYSFNKNMETVDGTLINKWIEVSHDMKPEISIVKVKEYVEELSKKYDTVGKEREFKSSVGKIVIVKGGYYGWKINIKEEIKYLMNSIENGQSVMREPIYSQKAFIKGEDDIGDTYVEVNITRQHLWYYKDGKLIVQGDVVTGCKNKNTPTYLGVYGLNYKQKGAILKGADYSSKVDYWMPFNGNIGLHDADWRSSFGGNIYKTNGTHGCINMPKYLAKTIFENIEANTPIICYSEEIKSSNEEKSQD